MSYQDALVDFLHAMELEGIRPLEPIAQRLSSGELIRFRCEGDGKGRDNGWAVLYLDERPGGAFGNHRLGISRKWHVGRDLSLSPEERRALSQEWAQAKAKRQEERQRAEREASIEAGEIWLAASPASPDHPYVARKRLDPSPLRQSGQKLLIPMYDGEGSLWNLQRIGPDGTKRFLRGGRTEALFCIIAPERMGSTAYIGEGYATMAAAHRASGELCIVAFSAKNLPAVARVWADHRPDLRYVICADNDAHLPRNLGVESAVAAAEEIRAEYVVPPELGEAP